MDIIEYFISITSSLAIALIAVYFDRFVVDKKEHKSMLSSILSEIEINVVTVDQIKKTNSTFRR